MQEVQRRPAGGECKYPHNELEETPARQKWNKGDGSSISWRRGVCLFFGLLLAIGFCTVPAYGLPWDEPEEQNILLMNLWEYCNVLGLDDSTFRELAEERRQDVMLDPYISKLTPISQSPHRDHGMVAYYPLAGAVMSRSITPEGLRLIWHLYTWLLFWFGSVGLYQSCRLMGLSMPIACLGAAMLMLSPRFFAEGHYNNKDIVLMVFVLIMIWQALRLEKNPTFGAGVLFALAGAITTGTKIVGGVVFCLCGMFVIASLVLKKQMNLRRLWVGAVTAGCFLVFYALLTPALWRDPIGLVGYLIGNAVNYTIWQGVILFRGTVFDTGFTLLPRYYLPYMVLVTTPLWILGLACIGQIAALKAIFVKKCRNRLSWLLLSLLWLVPVGFAMLTRTRVYNGWRHFYFIYGPILVLAAYGCSWLWGRIKGRKGLRRVGAILLAACMGATGISMMMNHPYQYVYYNPIPWVASGGNVNAYLERDYWNVSVADALVRLAQRKEIRTARQPVGVDGVDLWSRLGIHFALKGYPVETGMLREAENLLAKSPDFWLMNHTYQNFSLWQPLPGAKPVIEITAYGENLVTVYENTEREEMGI